MIEFVTANFAPLMFGGLITFLLYGFPVAFSLAVCGLAFGAIGVHLGLMPPALMQAATHRIVGILSNQTLLAIPYFTLMGMILERTGIAEGLLKTVGQLFGPVRGGLGYTVIIVGAILACSTGVVAADIISMGVTSLPQMLRYGYDPVVATGTIAASGTLAQIIPPSLVLFVIADQLGVSVTDLYAGAFIPGFGLAALYALRILYLSIFHPEKVPALPKSARTFVEADGSSGNKSLLVMAAVALASAIGAVHFGLPDDMGKDTMAVIGSGVFLAVTFAIALIDKLMGNRLISTIARNVAFEAVPALAIVILVLGTVFLGVASPTEGGAFGCAGAMLIALFKGKLTVGRMKDAVASTAKLSSFVMFILIGATFFSLVFQGVEGPKWVENMLLMLPGGQTGFIAFSMILIFLLSFFLDFYEVAFIVLPLLIGPMRALGIDPIFFGVLVGVNLQMSFLHPPFGFSLFYLRSVAPSEDYKDSVTGKIIPGITMGQIYRGAIPYICIIACMVAAIAVFPQIVTWGVHKDVEVMTAAEVDKALNEQAESDPWGNKADEQPVVQPEAQPVAAAEDSKEAEPTKGEMLPIVGAPGFPAVNQSKEAVLN
jgi:TRAP-type mannitol/chloroaromatic compound transport system permease large subunit